MALNKDKNLKLYFSISEVAQMFDVNESTLRFWEKEFDQIRPRKTGKGTRSYRQEDIDAIRLVYHLVKERGMTLAGARQKLKENPETTIRHEEIVNRLKQIKEELLASNLIKTRNMEITGRIIAVLPVQGGISKNGNEWKKQEYVLETHDQYPKKVCFQIFGADRIDQAAIQPGEELTVFFDIDSREYQGRWFTNINAWKVERPMAAAPQSAPGAMTPENVVPASAPAASAVPDFGPANPIDDLPF